MTVCIAARCVWNNKPVIVGASDRMITSGDTEFEPPQPKILQLTNSIAVLVAGDTAAQVEIYYHSSEDARQEIASEPNAWLSVEVAANIVARNVIRFNRQAAERAYLLPFGLDSATFLERQTELQPEWVSQTSRSIREHRSQLSTIVAWPEGAEGAKKLCFVALRVI